MQRTIDRFGRRYGPAFAFLMRSIMRLGWIRERRSGLIAGRLQGFAAVIGASR